MSISEMLGQSGLLTLLGMGVVFSFLVILMVFMHLLHLFVRVLKLDNGLEKKATIEKKASVAAAPVEDTCAVIAAIAVAVRERQSV